MTFENLQDIRYILFFLDNEPRIWHKFSEEKKKEIKYMVTLCSECAKVLTFEKFLAGEQRLDLEKFNQCFHVAHACAMQNEHSQFRQANTHTDTHIHTYIYTQTHTMNTCRSDRWILLNEHLPERREVKT